MEEKREINKQLPIFLKELILEIYQIIKEDKFILFGGAPIDYLLNGNETFNDLDVAIKKTNREEIKKFCGMLKRKGFEILVSQRKYILQKTKKVYLLYAKKEKMNLDVCFLDDFRLAPGPFNLDNLYCRYPELDVIDVFNTLDSIKNKIIIPTRAITKENPFLILSRFLRLCSKYEIYPMEKEKNKRLLIKIKIEIERELVFDKSDQYFSCINSLLISIIKSKNRIRFVDNIIQSGVINRMSPKLHQSLVLAIQENNQNRLKGAKGKIDLIVCLSNMLNNENKKSFLKSLSGLGARYWDQECVKFFNKL